MRIAWLVSLLLGVGGAHAVQPRETDGSLHASVLPLVATLPPFERIRTDYSRASLGSAADPLLITRCLLEPVVEWQETMCASIERAPRAWRSTHSMNAESGFDRYWVVAVNDEPAFQPSNLGPPNQSLAINGGAVMVQPLPGGVRLGLVHEEGAQPLPGGTPFVSYGLQAGRGFGETTLLAEDPAVVSFDVTLEALSGDDRVGAAIHFFVEVTLVRPGEPATRAAERRMLWLFLGEKNAGFNGAFNWNWPIVDSMWFPGNRIDFRTASEYARTCDASVAELPLDPAAVGRSQRYEIDLERMAACLVDAGDGRAARVSGIHFALEANFPRANVLRVRFERISLARKAR